MRGLFTPTVLLLVIFALSPVAQAKDKQIVPHAPLPEKVLAATRVYIENQSGYPEIGDKAYAALNAWGKYKIVSTRDAADLIVVMSVTSDHRSGTAPTYTTAYNFQTGAWVSGSSQAPSVDVWHYSELSLIDPSTGEVMWRDRRVWWRKHHATQELFDALRQRIEEERLTTAK